MNMNDPLMNIFEYFHIKYIRKSNVYEKCLICENEFRTYKGGPEICISCSKYFNLGRDGLKYNLLGNFRNLFN